MGLFSQSGPYAGLPVPKIMSGKVWYAPHLFASTTGLTVTASRYYVIPIPVPWAKTWTGAKFANTGTGDSGKKVKVAIYNEATGGGPGTLAKNFGEVTLDGTAAVRTLASSWTSAPGNYYFEIVSDTGPALQGMVTSQRDSGAGYYPYDAFSNYVSSFSADFFATNNIGRPAGDYVGGTYANFPESTSLTPTNTITSAITQAVPAVCLYV